MTIPGVSHIEITQGSIRRVKADRNPTSTDRYNFQLGDEWLNVSGKMWWKLVSLNNSEGATWVCLSGEGTGVLSVNNVNPTANNLQIHGNHPVNVSTNPSLSTIELGLEGSVPSFFECDIANTKAQAGHLKVIGTNGIETRGSENCITIANKGSVAQTFYGNVGSASPFCNVMKFHGSVGIKTVADENIIFIQSDSNVPLIFQTNSGVSKASSNVLKILGGTGITTSSDGNTIKVTALTPELLHLSGNKGIATSPEHRFNIVGSATSGINTSSIESSVFLSLNSPYEDGDFAFRSNKAGQPRTISIENRYVGADSQAILHLKVFPNGGNTSIKHSVDRARSYSEGINNSKDQSFDLYSSHNESDDYLIRRITGEGTQSIPLQPAFSAFVLKKLMSVTGDGTAYAVPFDFLPLLNGMSIDKDTFIINAFGFWTFSACLFIESVITNHLQGGIYLRVNDKYYVGAMDNPSSRKFSLQGCLTYNGNWSVPLNQGDKVSLVLKVFNGPKIINILGADYQDKIFPSTFSGTMLH